VVGPGWLATGDAAFTVDPLSGRGIVSALLTGRAAGEAAAAMIGGNRHPAAPAYTRLMGEIHKDGFTRQTEAYEGEGRWPRAPFWRRRVRSKVAGTPAGIVLEQARLQGLSPTGHA
jgi:flavin-dependent dehydrogenase